MIENFTSEMDYVKSELDLKQYVVRNLPDKQQAANLLSLMRVRLQKLVDYMYVKYPKDPRCQRLKQRFNPEVMVETNNKNEKFTSYSINKGEKIVFCMRQRNDKNQLVDINTMMFVAIHELAHLMTQSIGHKPEFWDNMRFLLKHAMDKKLNLYNYQPFHQTPQPYCGTMITDTPLKI